MTNIFRRMSDNTQPVMLFVWLANLLLVFLSVVLMIEDYETSRAGYLMLPTQKIYSGWVTFAVAALPQAGQIVLFYIFGRNTKRGWALLLAITFFLADLATDSWFKSGGQWSLMPLAIVESLFLFSFGSEMLFTITIGFAVESFGDFIVVFSAIVRTMMDAFRNAMVILGLSSEDDYRPDRKVQ